jgi:hypothetical protein
MQAELVYEIDLEGLDLHTYSAPTISTAGVCRHFPISFKMMRKQYSLHVLYEVWFRAGFDCLICETFRTYQHALQYINKAMKSAMKGKFLYQPCMYCPNHIYYPLSRCERCGRRSDNPYPVWEVENQIEKNPGHMWLFMKNEHPTPKGNFSTFHSLTTPQKL